MQEGSDIRTIDDLDGKTVGVQKGTTGEAYVQDNADPGDLRSYPRSTTLSTRSSRARWRS